MSYEEFICFRDPILEVIVQPQTPLTVKTLPPITKKKKSKTIRNALGGPPRRALSLLNLDHDTLMPRVKTNAQNKQDLKHSISSKKSTW